MTSIWDAEAFADGGFHGGMNMDCFLIVMKPCKPLAAVKLVRCNLYCFRHAMPS